MCDILPRKKQKFYTTVAANTYEIVSDIQITVPAGKVAIIHAYGYSSQTYCTGIKIVYGNDLSVNPAILSTREQTDDISCLSTDATFANTGTTDKYVNIAVRYKAIGTNYIGAVYFIV